MLDIRYYFKLSACGGLSNPTDGSVVTSNGNFVGSIASFTCDEGFEITGLSQLVCLGNGSWSESAPTCTPVGKVKKLTPKVPRKNASENAVW